MKAIDIAIFEETDEFEKVPDDSDCLCDFYNEAEHKSECSHWQNGACKRGAKVIH